MTSRGEFFAVRVYLLFSARCRLFPRCQCWKVNRPSYRALNLVRQAIYARIANVSFTLTTAINAFYYRHAARRRRYTYLERYLLEFPFSQVPANADGISAKWTIAIQREERALTDWQSKKVGIVAYTISKSSIFSFANGRSNIQPLLTRSCSWQDQENLKDFKDPRFSIFA